MKSKAKSKFPHCKGPLIENCTECEELPSCHKKNLKPYSAIPIWIQDQLFPIMSGAAIRVFIYLVRITEGQRLSRNFGTCWPSNTTISEKTGVSKTNINKQMKELEKLGLIKRDSRSGLTDNGWMTTRTITLPHIVNFERFSRIKK
jgi:hypothetical protein